MKRIFLGGTKLQPRGALQRHQTWLAGKTTIYRFPTKTFKIRIANQTSIDSHLGKTTSMDFQLQCLISKG